MCVASLAPWLPSSNLLLKNNQSESSPQVYHKFVPYIVAERLSARQLIVQCGLKSQLAYIYIYICAQLPSRLGMQLKLRLRSLYVLLLCLYVLYTCCYYSCNETLPAPGAPRGASACSRWRPDELHGCRLCTSDARRNSDLDKSITSFYQGRLTTAPTRLEFV